MSEVEFDSVPLILEAINREAQRVGNHQALQLRDELRLRLYPLLRRVLIVLTDRIEELEYDADAGNVSVDLAGRILALLVRYGQALDAASKDGECAKPTPELCAALQSEADAVAAELGAIFAEEVIDEAAAEQPERESPQPVTSPAPVQTSEASHG